MRRLVRFREVTARVGYSRPTLYRKIAEGKFPRPINLDENGRSVAFLESDIDAWIEQRLSVAEGTRLRKAETVAAA